MTEWTVTKRSAEPQDEAEPSPCSESPTASLGYLTCGLEATNTPPAEAREGRQPGALSGRGGSVALTGDAASTGDGAASTSDPPRSRTLPAADWAGDEDGVLNQELRRELAREYDIRERIGQGGFGAVYRGVHRRTHQEVALKVLRPVVNGGYRQMRSRVARFEREAELCANLNHPNIVRLLDRGKLGREQCYAVFELVPGETLRERLLRKRVLPALEAAEIMAQALDAVACAQAQGIVHRDLKPENIMVTDTGRRLHVKVLDFGIGTLTLEARDRRFRHLTESRETLGTPLYSAPEQLRGEAPTTRSDLYSWALVMLECLIGRPPVEGATLAQVYHQHLSSLEIPLPAPLARHSLGELLRRLLRKNPMARPADANQVYKEFQALHLANLVGDLGPIESSLPGSAADTAQSTLGLQRAQLRQVTALAVGVRVYPTEAARVDSELLETLHRDQLHGCRDVCERFGGRVVGGMGEHLLVYFGLPTASDTDARRAARSAFEVLDEHRQRREWLSANQPVEYELRVGLHTGTVMVVDDGDATGVTASVALSLCAAASSGSILVSETTRRLLEASLLFDTSTALVVNGRSGTLEAAVLVGERRLHALAGRGDGQTELVGREAELGQLDERWAQALQGDPRALILVGEPGVGKSRLLTEWIQHNPQVAAALLETRCFAEHTNDALFPILQLLKHEWRLDASRPAAVVQKLEERLRHHRLSCEALLPIYCVWLGLPIPKGYPVPAVAPHRQRELLMNSLAQLLPRLREHGLLLVEDLHWADASTLQLLNQLTSGAGVDLFVVASARPRGGLMPPVTPAQRLELGPLRPPQALQLVRRRLSGQGIEEPALKAIADRADGVPLFIEELSHMLLERRAAGDDDSLARDPSPGIPITLRALLAERLDRLSGAREVAQTAAALGREFDAELLVLACPSTSVGTRDALQQLVRAELLVRVHERDTERYSFRHALLRDAAYESMPNETRRQTHRRIAHLLEHEAGVAASARPEEIARHYAGALVFDAAVEHGLRAVRKLIERSANQEAMAQALEVERWLSGLPEPGRIDAELRNNGLLTQALMASEGWASPRVRERAEQSRKRLHETTAKEHVVSTLFALFMHYHVASSRARCREVAVELQQHAERVADPALLSVAATAQGVRCHAEGDFVQAERWLERARALYVAERDARQGVEFGLDCRVWATAQLALVQFGRGHRQGALALAAEATAWAREIEHVPSLGIALLYTSQIHQMLGDKAAALRVTGELLTHAQSFGLPAFEGYAAAIRAWAEGDEEAVANVIAILEQLNCHLILSYYGSYLAALAEDRGRLDEAAAQWDLCLRRCASLDEHCFEAELLRRRAACEVQQAAPDLDRARQWLERATALSREQGMYRFELLALRDLQRHFSLTPEQLERVCEIQRLRPELVELQVVPAGSG